MTMPGTDAGAPLLALLHLCDSLFPIGGFAHSDGLEAATASGRVATAHDLRGWMTACLFEMLGPCEGRAVAGAWRAFKRGDVGSVREVNAEVYALRPSSSARQASRSMGARLVRTWIQTRPGHCLDAIAKRPDGVTLPVAFACVCASEDLDLRTAVHGYVYTRLASTTSAAMRLMPIGQQQAHAMLADLLASVPAVADEILASGGAPAAFLPAFDLASMSQQYVHSRLFRS
jgi:urease accessory protein